MKSIKFDLTMTPDNLLHNHKNCLLKIRQFDLCLVSEIFALFPVFMFDFACNGCRSAAVLRSLLKSPSPK